MDGTKLVQMANQIGSFFESMPDPAEAQSGVVNHIRATWDPRMREAFKQHLAAHGHEALSPLLQQVASKLISS